MEDVSWHFGGALHLPRVRDQGDICGCCALVSTAQCTAAYHSIMNTTIVEQYVPPPVLSYQEPLDLMPSRPNTRDFVFPDNGRPCFSTMPGNVFEYIKIYSIAREDDYPFVGQPTYSRRVLEHKPRLQIEDYEVKNEDFCENVPAIVSKHPIVGVFRGFGESLFEYNGAEREVYNGNHSGRLSDNIICHAVMIVGWGLGETTANNFFWIQNSWGPSWGLEGYARIRQSLFYYFAFPVGYSIIRSWE